MTDSAPANGLPNRLSRPDTLTVVLPTLNEAGNVGPLIAGLRERLAEANPCFLALDGPSRDGTAEEAQRAGARVVQEPGTYADALLRGLKEAASDWVLVLDADGSHDPGDALTLWQARETADLVVGSRLVRGGRSDAPWFRHTLSRLLSWLGRVVARLPVRDISSGFRLYRRELFTDASVSARYFDIQPALLSHAVARGARIVEVPISYRCRGVGKSKARVLRYGWAFLRTLWRLRRCAGGP